MIDQRVNQRFESLPLRRIIEHYISNPSTVKLFFCRQDPRAPPLLQLAAHLRQLQHLVGQFVEVHDAATEIPEDSGHGTLAAADSAGQTDDPLSRHREPLTDGPARQTVPPAVTWNSACQ